MTPFLPRLHESGALSSELTRIEIERSGLHSESRMKSYTMARCHEACKGCSRLRFDKMEDYRHGIVRAMVACVGRMTVEKYTEPLVISSAISSDRPDSVRTEITQMCPDEIAADRAKRDLDAWHGMEFSAAPSMGLSKFEFEREYMGDFSASVASTASSAASSGASIREMAESLKRLGSTTLGTRPDRIIIDELSEMPGHAADAMRYSTLSGMATFKNKDGAVINLGASTAPKEEPKARPEYEAYGSW